MYLLDRLHFISLSHYARLHAIIDAFTHVLYIKDPRYFTSVLRFLTGSYLQFLGTAEEALDRGTCFVRTCGPI